MFLTQNIPPTIIKTNEQRKKLQKNEKKLKNVWKIK